LTLLQLAAHQPSRGNETRALQRVK